MGLVYLPSASSRAILYVQPLVRRHADHDPHGDLLRFRRSTLYNQDTSVHEEGAFSSPKSVAGFHTVLFFD